MKEKIIGIFVCTLLISTILSTTSLGIISNKDDLNLIINSGQFQEREYGDAPEGDSAIAYPSLGVMGSFPTCKCCGPSGWVEHNNFGAWFGNGFDFEAEGNGGLCPQCFPLYDYDECFQDGDAGLIIPEPFTIDNTITVVPCPGCGGSPLGKTGQLAVWGVNIDIHVHNTMPSSWKGYFNLIIDWNQNGKWGDTGEHAVVNFYPIPNPYDGPISGLNPPNFVIGPNPGYVWARFTISEKPVPANWDGAEGFEDGESEDYLLLIEEDITPEADLECDGHIIWKDVGAGTTQSDTFKVKNVGTAGSLLNWQIKSYPTTWGTWSFSPSSGTGLPAGSSTTVIVTCIAPSQTNKKFTGDIVVENTDDPTDTCSVPVELSTPRLKEIHNIILQRLMVYLKVLFPFLELLF